jgi:hypothetical protein
MEVEEAELGRDECVEQALVGPAMEGIEELAPVDAPATVADRSRAPRRRARSLPADGTLVL